MVSPRTPDQAEPGLTDAGTVIPPGAAEVYPGPGDLLAALDGSLLGKVTG